MHVCIILYAHCHSPMQQSRNSSDHRCDKKEDNPIIYIAAQGLAHGSVSNPFKQNPYAGSSVQILPFHLDLHFAIIVKDSSRSSMMLFTFSFIIIIIIIMIIIMSEFAACRDKWLPKVFGNI